METTKFFLGLLDREATASRKVLEQVPEGRNGWKPHERSMEMGYLAAVVAQMPAWMAVMLKTEELELTDKQATAQFQSTGSASRSALLGLAEESYAKAKAAFEAADEESLDKEWSFKLAGKALKSAARRDQIADVFTHLAHHRGQLTVYLRMNDAKVPAIYGPSADEPVG